MRPWSATQGEIFGLQWADLDIDGKRLAVKYTLEEVRGKLRLKSPKSRAGRRSIDLLDITVDALRAHKARMMTEGLLAQSYVFTDTLGNPIRKSNFERRVWKPIRTAAEIPEIRFHDLRHTHATVGLESGVEMKSMQERLGHSTITLTLDTYSHVTPQ